VRGASGDLQGGFRSETEFDVIAVTTNNGGSPCGGCRQVLAEFGLDTIVLIADGEGKLQKEMTVSDYCPKHSRPRIWVSKKVDRYTRRKVDR